MLKNLTDIEIEELARIKRNEYNRNWKRANPEKNKMYQDRYWAKKALEDKEVAANE